MDEQIYPVEKSTDVELVATMSASQIRWMLRASDPEAMFAAARGYLRTAEKLDALAEGIQQCSADLAAAWRGVAAAESQEQLRSFYGSARSLAVAARSSAIAVDHAAQALALARYRASMLPGGNLPSTDPHSMQSWSHQAVLADLNSAYRDATTMAPNQIAMALPPEAKKEGGLRAEWEREAGGNAAKTSSASVSSAYGAPSLRPAMLPPMVPSNPSRPSVAAGDQAEVQGSFGLSPQGGLAERGDQPGSGGSTIRSESPYSIGGQLAGGGWSAIGPNGVSDRHLSAGQTTGPTGISADRLDPNRVAGVSRGDQGSQSGIFPSGQGRREEDHRERRYYLKEERDVWGERNATPTVLYGEHRPPASVNEDDDDF